MAKKATAAQRTQAALTWANGQTHQAMASAASVDVRTIRRWLKDDAEFQAECKAHLDEIVERGRNLTAQGLVAAAAANLKLLKSRDESIIVRAARTLTGAGIRALERADRTTDGDYSDLDAYLASR